MFMSVLLRVGFLLGAVLWSWNIQAANLPEGFAEVQIASGLNPTAMAMAPDGTLFITQKDGRIMIVRDGLLLPQPAVTLNVDPFNERGLSGIAIDPNFAETGYIYVFYTVPNDNFNRISRLTFLGDFFVPGSEQVLMEIDPMPGSIHNAGAMHFGPDGYLYITTGDGADAITSQSLTTLGGKVLRISPDGSIPPDNPFYNQTTGNNRAIWAMGFRNPFSSAIDPATGLFFINDVGGADFEEVNSVVRGGNYGWPLIEGLRTNQNQPANYQDPLHAYSHQVGCAVVGATFYRADNPSFPAFYHGKYFFADYCEGFIKVMNPQTGVIEEIFATDANRPLQLLVAPNGDLYYLSRAGIGGGSVGDNTSTNEGALYRVFYQGMGAPVVSVQPRDVFISAGEEGIFTVRASGTPPFTYQWQRDGVPVSGANDDSLIVSNAQLSDSGAVFTCLIGNASGQIPSNAAKLLVTADQRPNPFIEFPGDGYTWRAGDTLRFGGYASDPEDGELGSYALTWRIDLHHNDHSHPALQPTPGISQGQLIIPRFGEVDHNLWLRVYLTATDSKGLSKTVYSEYFPQKSQLTLVTRPAGLEMIIDGRRVTTPHTQPVVIGLSHTVTSGGAQARGDSVYSFLRFANNGSSAVNFPFFAFPNDTTLVADFEGTPYADGTGLLGVYYRDDEDLVFDFREKPAFFRVDPTVDFDWLTGSPAPGFPEDDFAVQWIGEVTPLFTEWVDFQVESDDGVRLRVNNELIIDQWVLQGATVSQGGFFMEKGRKYPILLEYFERGGDAVVKMRWQGEKTPLQIIPSKQLFPADRFGIRTDPFFYDLRVMGNPVEETLRIQVSLNQPERLRFRLMDTQGRTVWTARQNLDSALENLEYDVRHISSGLYFLEVEGDREIPRQILKVVF